MQVGIELSEDEGDLDPFEDDLAVRGKGGRKTGGRQTATADAAAAAKQLQKVLQQAQWLLTQAGVFRGCHILLVHLVVMPDKCITVCVHCVYTDTSMYGHAYTVGLRGLLLSTTGQVTMA